MAGLKRRVILPLFVLMVLVAGLSRSWALELTQQPLFIDRVVPGNLALPLSVEYPTVLSRANLNLSPGDTSGNRTSYIENRRYYGYFSADFCYRYSSLPTITNQPSLNADHYFYPVRRHNRADHRCNTGLNTNEWSGNFLAWATTQTIDTFRLAMTGGYRVRDEVGRTWLQKARHNWNLGFAFSTVPASVAQYTVPPLYARELRGVTSDNALDYVGLTYFGIRLQGYSNQLRIGNSYFYTRVEVCNPSFLESFCVKYSDTNYKPEGVLQRYSQQLRYSVFSYLNDDSHLLDGGVLRAEQKYIGEKRMTQAGDWENNPNREWNPQTGVMVRNPDGITRAMDTVTIADSGVLNYINKFGELNTSPFKSYDPVSELYYTAYRYLSALPDVPEYNLPKYNSRERAADNFPVITNWINRPDPIQFWCQPNYILGIGDVFNHKDKNLPGNTAYRNQEPGMPPLVAADTTVNVVTETNRVGLLEGLGNIGNTNQFRSNDNSAYIAGLAYRARTRDIRPANAVRNPLPGNQTISTFWVDVMEGASLQAPSGNQYYLATKYGGFTVPDGFNPLNPDASLIEDYHWTQGDTLTASNGTTFKRPRNYYLAGQAQTMIESLNHAFTRIVAEMRGSASAIGHDGQSVAEGGLQFASSFVSGSWRGELTAYPILASGTVSQTPRWRASSWLDTLSDEDVRDPAKRNVLTSRNGQLVAFTAANASPSLGDLVGISREQLINYVRGDQSLEYLRGGALKDRTSRLGSIINSSPVYSQAQDFQYQRLITEAEKATYPAFVQAKRGRGKVVFVGSNGGMLHAFNAETGREIFAYVPTMLHNRLHYLADPDKAHRYFVDGVPLVTDAFLNGQWKTILIGTLGAGGKGLFALDVTDPHTPRFLWEFEHDLMGEGVAEAILVRDATGWKVVVGNGYNSRENRGALLVINAATGALIQGLAVPGTANGLATATAINFRDYRNLMLADTIYAGDMNGRLWRFGYDTASNAWRLGSQPLFTTRSNQPITKRVEVALNRNRQVMVFLGTGKYLEELDVNNKDLQTFYGIVDRGDGQTVSHGSLVKQDFIGRVVETDGIYQVFRTSTNRPLGNNRGWYIDLAYPSNTLEGERVVTPATVYGNWIIFSSLIPTRDVCSAGGTGFVTVLDLTTGGRVPALMTGGQPQTIMVNGEAVPVSSSGFMSGIPQAPSVDAEGNLNVGLSSGERVALALDVTELLQRARTSWREITGE